MLLESITLVCDNGCGTQFGGNDAPPELVISKATDNGWIVHHGKHFCSHPCYVIACETPQPPSRGSVSAFVQEITLLRAVIIADDGLLEFVAKQPVFGRLELQSRLYDLIQQSRNTRQTLNAHTSSFLVAAD